MPLPPPDQIEKLFAVLRLNTAQGGGAIGGSFDKMHSDLTKILRMIGTAGAQGLVTGAINSAVGTAQVSVGVGLGALGTMSIALMPIGQALAPWLGAAVIYSKADGIFAFHDLKKFAAGGAGAHYRCSCGKCVEGLQCIIDKKENNVAIFAVSIFLAGLPLMVDKLNSLRKRGQKNRPKEMYSRQFVTSARGGCVNAMAAIMLLCGDWPKDKPADRKLLIEAIVCLLATDGWERVKSKW